VQLRIRGKISMIQVVIRFERDSMELWVESHDYVAEIERLVFNQTPQLVTVTGFEKESRYDYEARKETGVTYYLKQLNFPSVKVWGLEVIDYTDEVKQHSYPPPTTVP
jgi:hypothetical protein